MSTTNTDERFDFIPAGTDGYAIGQVFVGPALVQRGYDCPRQYSSEILLGKGEIAVVASEGDPWVLGTWAVGCAACVVGWMRVARCKGAAMGAKCCSRHEDIRAAAPAAAKAAGFTEWVMRSKWTGAEVWRGHALSHTSAFAAWCYAAGTTPEALAAAGGPTIAEYEFASS